MKVFIQSIFAQLLFTPYIWYRGCQALPPKRSARVPFTLLCILEVSLYLVGLIFRKEFPDSIMTAIQMICNTWYIASIYIVLILFSLEAIRLSNKLWKWFPAFVIRNYARIKLTLFFAVIAGVSTLMVHAYRTVAYPSVKHVYITLPKSGGVRDSVTIAMMSDLHIGEVVGRKFVERYVDLCNAQHPDLVVLVGDIIDYEVRFAEKERVEEVLQQLKAPLGVYIVNGNHEYRANIHAKEKWLKTTGAILLKDSVVMPDSSFYIVGRDDRTNKKRAALQTLMNGIDHTKPIIILDHQPESFAEIAMNKGDLGLHGHTHNGQIWPYSLVVGQVFECAYGQYKKGDAQFYISSGIGIAGPPYRVGTASELVILHITFEP